MHELIHYTETALRWYGWARTSGGDALRAARWWLLRSRPDTGRHRRVRRTGVSGSR